MKCDCCGQPAPKGINKLFDLADEGTPKAYICHDCSGLTVPNQAIEKCKDGECIVGYKKSLFREDGNEQHALEINFNYCPICGNDITIE